VSGKTGSMATLVDARLVTANTRDGADTRNKDVVTRLGGGDQEQVGQTAAELLTRIAELEKRVAELERPKTEFSLSPAMSLLRDIGEEIGAKQSVSDWVDSPFATINQLKPDHSGKVGELFVKRLCDSIGVSCVYNEDINDQDDGTYDAILNGKRVEIKTARFGKQGGFQHESLRTEGCDYYMFLDVLPTHFYITVSKKFDMTTQHPVLGRKPHLRKGATDVYKFDFGENTLAKGIRAGITIKVDNDTPMEAILDFINRQIV
jgi:hypothetical protein